MELLKAGGVIGGAVLIIQLVFSFVTNFVPVKTSISGEQANITFQLVAIQNEQTKTLVQLVEAMKSQNQVVDKLVTAQLETNRKLESIDGTLRTVMNRQVTLDDIERVKRKP